MFECLVFEFIETEKCSKREGVGVDLRRGENLKSNLISSLIQLEIKFSPSFFLTFTTDDNVYTVEAKRTSHTKNLSFKIMMVRSLKFNYCHLFEKRVFY